MKRIVFRTAIDVATQDNVDTVLGITIPEGMAVQILGARVWASRSVAGTVNHKDLNVAILSKDMGLGSLGADTMTEHTAIIARGNLVDSAGTAGSLTKGFEELSIGADPYALIPRFMIGTDAVVATGPTVECFVEVDYDFIKLNQAIATVLATQN